MKKNTIYSVTDDGIKETVCQSYEEYTEFLDDGPNFETPEQAMFCAIEYLSDRVKRLEEKLEECGKPSGR
jgi:hypothetical protein